MRTRGLGLGASLFALVFAALPAPAWGQASPLAQVPASAPIVVQLRGVERTRDRLTTMVEKAVPALAPKVREKLDEAFKQLEVSGRKLKGLAKDGPIFLVFTEMPGPGVETEESMAVVARVTRYAEFRDGLLSKEELKHLRKEGGYESTTVDGKDLFLVDRNDFVVLTPAKQVAQAFTQKQAGLDTKVSKEVARRLLGADLSLYVDMGAVNQRYGDQLQMVKAELGKLLEQGAGGLGSTQKAQLDLAKQLLAPAMQAVEDSRALVLTADLRPTGLALHAGVQIAKDSKTNNYLMDSRPSDLKDLGRLPAGQLSYSAMQLSPTVFKDFGPLMAGVGLDEGGPENKGLQAAVDLLAASGPKARYDCSNVPLQTLQVWVCAQPAKAVEGYLKLFQALPGGSQFTGAMIKNKPVVKTNAKKHRNINFHQATIVWDFDKLLDEQAAGAALPPEMKQQFTAGMKKLIGAGANIWFGTDGKVVLQAIGKDWKGAQEQIDRFLDSKVTASNLPAFTETRAQVPAETTMVLLLDLPRYAHVMYDMMQGMLQGVPGGLPFALPPLPPYKGSFTYLGMAVTLQPENAGFDLWLPGASANELWKMFAPLMQNLGGAPPGGVPPGGRRP